MAVSFRGAISFGLVHIPVELYTATQDVGISFNQLHKPCGQRIKYKKVCPYCEQEVQSEDIVKGYEYEKDKYVVLTDDDFEAIKTEKDKSISIIAFIGKDEIDPIFFEKSYHAVPDGSEKAYELLRLALSEENKIALAQAVIGTKEHILAIRAAGEGLVLETLYYLNEIKPVPKSFVEIKVSDAELTMAKTLIRSMAGVFDPAAYRDSYQERLKEAIQAKIAGQEIVQRQEPEQGNVIDLMAALQASLDAAQSIKPKPARKKAGADND